MAKVEELFSLACKHYQAGGFTQAEQIYRQILQHDPRHADAWSFLGAACQAQGKLVDAEVGYRRAVEILPHYASAANCLGVLLAQQARLAEAIACFQQALRTQPNNADLHNNLGLAFARQGRSDEAAASFRQALRCRPEYAEAHYNLGLELNAQSRSVAALAHFDEAVRLKPDYSEAWNDRGNVLTHLERLDQAEDSYRQALRLRPDYARACYNLAIALEKREKHDEAVVHYRQALHCDPAFADAFFNLGNALHRQGKIEEAKGCFLNALRLRPDHPQTNLSCALVWLLLGDYERGWPAYTWRLKQADIVERSFSQPLWDGSDFAGRTILLHAELGLGDTFQFIRYAPLVKDCGGKVIAECQAALKALLADTHGIDQLVGKSSPLPGFDLQASLLTLPAICRTTLATVPAPVPYLRADSNLVQKWERELEPLPGFKIGITWQGNPIYGHDLQRSIPLACFEPLGQIDGVQLISLQKGSGSSQLSAISYQPERGSEQSQGAMFTVHDLGTGLDEASGAFMDTAAVMMNLDLVISSDTAIPHLAGALGVPVWLALPFVPDWRWLLEREDCPWYPTMRLFRQTQAGHWHGVFERMAAEVRNLLTVAASSGR